jgi:hypothetical protein
MDGELLRYIRHLLRNSQHADWYVLRDGVECSPERVSRTRCSKCVEICPTTRPAGDPAVDLLPLSIQGFWVDRVLDRTVARRCGVERALFAPDSRGPK